MFGTTPVRRTPDGALWDRASDAPYGATPYTGAAQPVSPPPYQRFLDKTGFRYTWVIGSGDGDEMQEQDLETQHDRQLCQLLRQRGRLRASSRLCLYLARRSLAAGRRPICRASCTPPTSTLAGIRCSVPQLSAEVNFRPGVFSDFQTVTTDSIRLLGSGIGVIKLGPTSSLKLGAIYIDRADVKLLPAFGVLWTPNAQTRWDIFFPSPKLSHYWKTVNNGQLWWYVGAEYGGGSWTMDRQEDPDQGRQRAGGH